MGNELVARVLAGGYPEAIARATQQRRQDWFLNYLEAIIQRDVREVAKIEQLDRMPQLLRVLAEHTGQLVNYSGVGAAIQLNHITTQKYTAIFEQLFLLQKLAPWYTNTLNRLSNVQNCIF